MEASIEIHIDEECGNAPKKAVIRDLLVHLARGDHDAALGFVADGIQWERAGGVVASGREQVADLVRQLTDRSAISFTVNDILSHGDRCAASGTFRRKDGSQFSVAHFFRFSGHGKNAKICRVVTYTADTGGAEKSAS